MKKYIFLLGRPGCGKSAVYRRAIQDFSEKSIAVNFERIDDFPRILIVNEQDKEQKRHKPMADGGFLITDDTVWDDVLRIVNDDAKKASADNKIIFIEFARNN